MAIGKQKRQQGQRGASPAHLRPRALGDAARRHEGYDALAGVDDADAWLEDAFPLGLPEGFM